MVWVYLPSPWLTSQRPKNRVISFCLGMKSHSSILEVFFYKSFSKFGPGLQQSALQPASAGALHRMPSSRKWSDLSIRKENQSHGQIKTQKNLFAAVSEVNFLWCNSLEQDKKSVVQGCRMDMMGGTAAGMLEGGEDGCSCASLQHSECCTAEHQRHQCSLPSFPGKPTAAGLALHDSRASGVQQLGASQAG